MTPSVWMSRITAANVWDLAYFEVELLCRAGIFIGRKNSVKVPSGWSHPKKREQIRNLIATATAW